MKGEQSTHIQKAGVRPGKCMPQEPRQAVFRKDGVATWQKAIHSPEAGVKLSFGI